MALVASISEAVPYALTSKTVEPIPTLGALFPRCGSVQDPVLTRTEGYCSSPCSSMATVLEASYRALHLCAVVWGGGGDRERDQVGGIVLYDGRLAMGVWGEIYTFLLIILI